MEADLLYVFVLFYYMQMEMTLKRFLAYWLCRKLGEIDTALDALFHEQGEHLIMIFEDIKL